MLFHRLEREKKGESTWASNAFASKNQHDDDNYDDNDDDENFETIPGEARECVYCRDKRVIWWDELIDGRRLRIKLGNGAGGSSAWRDATIVPVRLPLRTALDSDRRTILAPEMDEPSSCRISS